MSTSAKKCGTRVALMANRDARAIEGRSSSTPDEEHGARYADRLDEEALRQDHVRQEEGGQPPRRWPLGEKQQERVEGGVEKRRERADHDEDFQPDDEVQETPPEDTACGARPGDVRMRSSPFASFGVRLTTRLQSLSHRSFELLRSRFQEGDGRACRAPGFGVAADQRSSSRAR